MKVRLIRRSATPTELSEMLEFHGNYIKTAVDTKRGILAGGGEFHADCEELLIENGSQQVDIWGADWEPASQTVTFEALINIRPRQGNRSMIIQDEKIRQVVESIVRNLLAKE